MTGPAGRSVAPYALTSLSGPFGAWSADNRHVIALGGADLSCVFDAETGACSPVDTSGDEAIDAAVLADGARLAIGVFETGQEGERLCVGPAAGPFTTIAPVSRFHTLSPIEDRLAFTDFPYFHADRPTNVFTVNADGTANQVIARTPVGWLARAQSFTPDGQWVLVNAWTRSGSSNNGPTTG